LKNDEIREMKDQVDNVNMVLETKESQLTDLKESLFAAELKSKHLLE